MKEKEGNRMYSRGLLKQSKHGDIRRGPLNCEPPLSFSFFFYFYFVRKLSIPLSRLMS